MASQLSLIHCPQCGARFSELAFADPDYRVLKPSPTTIAQIRSNYFPPEGEMGNIATKVEETLRAIKERDEEISRLRSTVERLESERDNLRRYLEHYRTFFSPIRKVPAEVLTEILSYRSSLVISNGVKSPTLDFSQVCNYWRELVSSCSQLWSSYHIDLPDINAGMFSLMDYYVVRSNPSPLTLHISDLGDDPVPGSRQSISEIGLQTVATLLHHSNRWRNLTLDVAYVFCMRGGILDDHNVSFPKLETLKLTDGSGTSSLLSDGNFANALKEAPRLRTMNFEFYCGSFNLSSYTSQLSQMTTLNLHCSMELNDVSGVLSACPHLKRLETHDHIIAFHDHIRSQYQPVVHDSLQELTLHFLLYERLSLALEGITLPNLISLNLCSSEIPHSNIPDTERFKFRNPPHQQWIPDDLLIFLRRSGCSLKTLSLGTFEILGDSLRQIFETTPDLTRLSLREYYVSLDTALLSSLTLSASSNTLPLLPRLIDLEVGWHEYKHHPDDVLNLVLMVESRSIGRHAVSDQNSVAGIRRFSFRYSRVHSKERGYQVHPELLSRMKVLSRSCVDVSMKHMDGKRIRLLR